MSSSRPCVEILEQRQLLSAHSSLVATDRAVIAHTASTTLLTHPLVWKTAASAPHVLGEARSVTVNGKLYVFGGYNATSPNYQATTASEVYDPLANRWAGIAPMPVPATHMAVATDGTSIYVAGGYTYNPKTTYQTFGTTSVWRYNIASNKWSAFASLPAPIGAGTMVLLGTKLHFFDGVNPKRVGQTEHWVLDLSSASPKWTNAAPMPFTANHVAAAVLNGKIYAIGGQGGTDDSKPITTVLIWDPGKPTLWTRAASMPIPRSHTVVAVVDGEILVAGGASTNGAATASVILYNPATNRWTSQTSLPAGRIAAVGGMVGKTLVFSTGFDRSGRLQATSWVAAI